VGLLALLALAGGCGDGDSESGNPTGQGAAQREEQLAEPPPKGASLLLRQIYQQFQPPQPDPRMKERSAKVIKAGERACKGKTPLEVREEFIAESDLSEDQAEAVSELEKYEENPSPNFVAGQLGALVYENALPEKVARYGYQGCVYSLSLGLKRELAPRGGS
jgi:hypothetical protein